MPKDIYLKLRDFLNKLPAGFPATESGVEIKILKKLFTPEQATIALQLRIKAGTSVSHRATINNGRSPSRRKA